MGVSNSIKLFNSTIRTALAAAVVGGAGYAGYQGYAVYNEPIQKLQAVETERDAAKESLKQTEEQLASSKEINNELELQVTALDKKVERLDTSLQLLKINERLAQLRVIKQEEVAIEGTSEEDDAKPKTKIMTTVEFFETTPDGKSIGKPRRFDIEGDRIYIEYLVAKFDDKYVEQSDIDRSTAICLFQRIFGEHQDPSEGFELDHVGTRPTAYARGGKMSEFEKSIWADFWTIANDRERARELGIRAAHGNAPSIRVKPNMIYDLHLRSTGEFSLRPREVQPGPPEPMESSE